MANCKFKVGDRVIGNNPNRYAYTKLGWKGVVVKVNAFFNTIDVRGEGNKYNNQTFHGLEVEYFDLVERVTEEKIIITHDGKVTTATLYGVMGKVTATARCAPEDTFDFNVGAKLAMERLMEKTKKPEPPKYYNGKVVYIADKSIGWTVGKVYEFVNGVTIDDDGDERFEGCPIRDIKCLCSQFLPLVE